MYTLYGAPGTASLAVHWLLIDLDVPHQWRPLDLAAGEHRRAEYLALNPGGVVPTLVADGVALCESGAILLHLADAHPQAGFAPAPGSLLRARHYQWMVWLANALQPAFRAWFYPHEPAGTGNVDAARQAARERIEACWDRLDAHLGSSGPYLLGESPSAADFMLTMLMRWSRNMPRPADRWPALATLAATMKARPSFRTLYEREGLEEWA